MRQRQPLKTRKVMMLQKVSVSAQVAPRLSDGTDIVVLPSTARY
jgi:hypothetical protein